MIYVKDNGKYKHNSKNKKRFAAGKIKQVSNIFLIITSNQFWLTAVQSTNKQHIILTEGVFGKNLFGTNLHAIFSGNFSQSSLPPH